MKKTKLLIEMVFAATPLVKLLIPRWANVRIIHRCTIYISAIINTNYCLHAYTMELALIGVHFTCEIELATPEATSQVP